MTTCIVCGGSEITRTLSPATVGGRKVFCAKVLCSGCGNSGVAADEVMDVAVDLAADAFESGPAGEPGTRVGVKMDGDTFATLRRAIE